MVRYHRFDPHVLLENTFDDDQYFFSWLYFNDKWLPHTLSVVSFAYWKKRNLLCHPVTFFSDCLSCYIDITYIIRECKQRKILFSLEQSMKRQILTKGNFSLQTSVIVYTLTAQISHSLPLWLFIWNVQTFKYRWHTYLAWLYSTNMGNLSSSPPGKHLRLSIYTSTSILCSYLKSKRCYYPQW